MNNLFGIALCFAGGTLAGSLLAAFGVRKLAGAIARRLR